MLGEGNTMLAERCTSDGRHMSLIPSRVVRHTVCRGCSRPVYPPCDGCLAGGRRQFVLRAAHADATTVAAQLRQMLKEYGAEAEVLIDKSQNQIVVRGTESSRQLAGQLIGTLDKAATASPQTVEPGKVAGYSVAADRIDAVCAALSSGSRRRPECVSRRIGARRSSS